MTAMATSLIQRAVDHPGWQGVAVPGRHTGGDSHDPLAPTAAAVDLPNAGPGFRLNWRRLARQGFITPSTLDSPLAREVSAAKRRLIRQLDLFRHPGKGQAPAVAGNTVLITSAEPGEGKSFAAVNLALSFVLEERLPVALLDADLAAPSLERTLDLEPRRGLSERLADPSLDLDRLLHRADAAPLSVLPAGDRPSSPAQLLGGAALPALLAELARLYRGGVVILDGPPVLATNEAPVLAHHASQVILVVGASRATEESVGAALELLDCSDRVALLLNRSRTTTGSTGYGRSYGSAG